jgi:predicted MFS family arabinose efflux permease
VTQYAIRPSVLLVFLAAANFLAMTVWLMLGPLLVELAAVFHTSVAITGQLTAATAVTWALTAFLAGPVSDIYGRRRMLLTGLMLTVLGTLSAAFAWNFGALLAFRCLTGVGAAMIPPNCLATIADVFPPAQRGKAMGWVISATGLGTAFGVPLVALLSDIGGWRVPFYVIGALLLLLWGLLWIWFPTSQAEHAGHTGSFVAHFQAVGVQAALWFVLAANCLQVMAFMGMSSYLAAYLMHTYRLSAGATALPLIVAGLGVIAGSLIGGCVAGQASRVAVVALAFVGGGFGAALVFMTDISPWVTVILAFSVAALLPLSWPVTAVLLTELAGQSRATATGLFAVSNQLGAVGGASLGGVLLALGGFPLVGMFCLVTAALAAGVLRGKVHRAVVSPLPLSPS